MSKYTITGAILSGTGVPKSVLKFAERYSNIEFSPVPYTKNGEHKRLPADKQKSFFQNSYTILSDNPLRVLLYSDDDINYARAVALRIYMQFLGSASQPIWHLPSEDFGIKQDELLTDLRMKPKLPLAVLDNLNTFMGQSKTEKVTRALAIAGCPLLLIVAGKRPYQYCIDKLGFTPDFVIRPEKQSKKSEMQHKRERI